MTVPHYGKRRGGALTAVSPGETLYFCFGSYNDSGDSEAMTGLAVSDIEVIKNGGGTVRATDSGYSLIDDTGQVDERVGLHRFSIQLFNTADDASFYAQGGWYQVFVDSVVIDGKTVRFWVGSFEIDDSVSGTDTGLRTYITQQLSFTDTGLRKYIDNTDTGIRDTLADYDTGLRDYIDNLDTGLRTYISTTIISASGTDTGMLAAIDQIRADVDTGLRLYMSDVAFGIYEQIWWSDTGQRVFLNAIQAKTDSLQFTTANNVDANIKYVNDTPIQGTGDTGTSDWWRPL